MNKVMVCIQGHAGGHIYYPRERTDDVNVAMNIVHMAWRLGLSASFFGPYGDRYLHPPIESVISQLPDDSQARHDRNRARQKLP